MKTVGGDVVGGEGEEWKNSSSEEMHPASCIWDRLCLRCLLDGHQVEKSNKQVLRNSQVVQDSILGKRYKLGCLK